MAATTSRLRPLCGRRWSSGPAAASLARLASLALLVSLTSFTALTVLPSSARADDGAAAEALFLEARELIAQKKYAQACPKLEASYKLDKGVGTLMNLADCHENIGDIATAWAEWGLAFDWLTRDGDKRATYAQERRSALTDRLPKLLIDVVGASTSLEIHRGATKIEPGAYNVALPVDPGPHILSVRRGEQVLKRESVTAVEGKTVTVKLDLAAIERSAPPPPPPPRRYGAAPMQRAYGYLIGGAGVAALATAGALEIAAIVNLSDAKDPDRCVNLYCSPNGIDSVERARTLAEVGQWVGVGGLVLTGVGLTLLLTAPPDDASAPPSTTGARAPAPLVGVRARIEPWIGPGVAGLAVRGQM